MNAPNGPKPANILVDPLPETVRVSGGEVPVKTGYRRMILFEMALSDASLTAEQKLEAGLDLLFGGSVPADKESAAEALLWFYRCGAEPSGNISEGASVPVYSFERDAAYIYAAFREQYGMDLLREKNLHWWVFSALFSSLSDELAFSRIMKYRAVKIDSSMTDGEKKFYAKMKRIYALPDNAGLYVPEADEEYRRRSDEFESLFP